MRNKQIVLTAGAELFGARDPSAVDRHYAPDFLQHSALAPDGTDGLKQMLPQLPQDFRIDVLRALEDGDLVALHSVYHGLGPETTVAVDVFRVAGGRIAEHWDAVAPLPAGPEGRHRTGGATEVGDPERTRANKAFVTEWVHETLIGGDAEALADLARSGRYAEHAPPAAGSPVRRRLHRVVAEGELVLTLTEADGAGAAPAACYDLWRVVDDRIVEHWQVLQPVPERMPHENGFF